VLGGVVSTDLTGESAGRESDVTHAEGGAGHAGTYTYTLTTH